MNLLDNVSNYEPKFNNRFIVNFPKELNIECRQVQKINKPKYSNFKWMNMEITFIDPISPSTSESLNELIKFIEIRKSVNNKTMPLFKFNIVSLDPTGKEVETWQISVEDIILIDFGEFDYMSDSLQLPKMIIKPLNCVLK